MEKLRVLLVDDDMLAVSYMRDSFDWQGFGYEVAGVAYNGRQALKLFRELSVNLVISDISMPLMDGIALVREIRKLDGDCHFVLLTAYSEFDYARRAIQEGVDDYLIKDELNEETLRACLDKVRSRVEAKRKVFDAVLRGATFDYMTRGDAYFHLHHGEGRIRDFFNGAQLALIVTHAGPALQGRGAAGSDAGQVSEICARILSEFPGGENCVSCSIPFYQLILWPDRPRGGERPFEAGGFSGFAEEFQRRLAQRCGDGAGVFYTPAPMRPALLREYLGAPGAPLLYADFATRAGGARPLPKLAAEEPRPFRASADPAAEAMLRAQTQGDCANILREALGLDRGERVAYADCLSFLQSLDAQLRKLLSMREAEAERAFDLEGCARRFFKLVERRRALSEELGGARPEVRRAIAYLHGHYANPRLRVQDVASEIGISSSRLSVIFKEDMGITINRYLTRLRMDAARELLERGDCRIYEIAQRVGYENSQYFSTIFYKETGLYPTQYKRGTK